MGFEELEDAVADVTVVEDDAVAVDAFVGAVGAYWTAPAAAELLDIEACRVFSC